MSTDQDYKLLVDTTAQLLETTEPGKVPATLAELGWYELLAEDERSAARALFGQQGRLARTSPMLSLLMGAAATGEDAAQATPALLPTLAAGATGWVEPGADGAISVLAQADALTGADFAVLAVRRGGAAELLRVPIASLTTTPVEGIDPPMGLAKVRATLDGAEQVASGADAEETWTASIALGRKLIAEEIAAVVARQLELAMEHATSRTQFGRLIGSYQAVKHKLAETLVAVRLAELAAEEAWNRPDAQAALMAKLLGGQSVEVAIRHCQQVLGGIGFTWEHSFHWYMRRGRMLDALLGSSAQLIPLVGAGIVESGELPVTASL